MNENPMLQFLRHGKIGPMHLGMHRDEVAAKMGLPNNWTGKPPTFGTCATSPDTARTWYYYNDSVGATFDQMSRIIALLIFPKHLSNPTAGAFFNNMVDSETTVGKFRQMLIQNQIDFEEGDPTSPRYWLLVLRDCTILSGPYRQGMLIHAYDRSVEAIGKFADEKTARKMLNK